MQVANNSPEGATVYITDLKLRLGQSSEVSVSIRGAAGSTDLLTAVEKNLVRITFTELEKNHPDLRGLVSRIKQAEARRQGALLYAEVKKAIETGSVSSPKVPVRPAVFAPVGV